MLSPESDGKWKVHFALATVAKEVLFTEMLHAVTLSV